MNNSVRPDCETCAHRAVCSGYQAGSFCARWQSVVPDRPEADDPGNAWRAGEEWSDG